MRKISFLVALWLTGAIVCFSRNPFLPLWEYIPDGEPYVFEDPDKPGQYRVYLYGSHDSRITDYCGREQVVWSAPVDNLSDWRYDGIAFKVSHDRDSQPIADDGAADVLMAPDIVLIEKPDGSKVYYFYPNNVEPGRENMVAKSDRPDGPFEVINWSVDDPKKTQGLIGFDPGVFVDDDGRVYAYWGFKRSYAAELDTATMATLKPGTGIVEDLIPSFEQDDKFRFYEASSMRKIKDKYVLIYSRYTRDGEFGLPIINYTLAYAYADNPLGPFTYGGTIVDGRARGIDDDGNVIPTAWPYGNTHGSLCEINGKWWVFYHRQTGTNEYSRQAMVAPVDVTVEEGPGGKVLISEAEYNSEGFSTQGLDPQSKIPAGLACYLVGPDKAYTADFLKTRPYVRPTYFDPRSFQGPFNEKIPFCPVSNITSGSVIGYKYFDFSGLKDCRKVKLEGHFQPSEIGGTVDILVGAPSYSQGARRIGTFEIVPSRNGDIILVEATVLIPEDLEGKQPLYFMFDSDVKETSIGEFHDFRFRCFD